MKKFLLGAFITFTGLLALATGAQAQSGNVVVHIQQDFIAGGKTLPAGTYKVIQDFTGAGQTLILRGDRESAFLLSSMRDAASAKQPAVKLTRVGDQYYLSQVATDFGVYTLPAPSRVTRMAKSRDRGMATSSASN
jgi:hypothetical protein